MSALDLDKLFKIFKRHYPHATRSGDQFMAGVMKLINNVSDEYFINVYVDNIVDDRTFEVIHRVILNYQGEVGSSVNIQILTIQDFKHAVKESWMYYESR